MKHQAGGPSQFGGALKISGDFAETTSDERGTAHIVTRRRGDRASGGIPDPRHPHRGVPAGDRHIRSRGRRHDVEPGGRADLRVVRERGPRGAPPLRPGREAGGVPRASPTRPPGRGVHGARAAPAARRRIPDRRERVDLPPSPAGRDDLRDHVDPDGRHRAEGGRGVAGPADDGGRAGGREHRRHRHPRHDPVRQPRLRADHRVRPGGGHRAEPADPQERAAGPGVLQEFVADPPPGGGLARDLPQPEEGRHPLRGGRRHLPGAGPLRPGGELRRRQTRRHRRPADGGAASPIAEDGGGRKACRRASPTISTTC